MIVFYHHSSAQGVSVMWPGSTIPAPWANTTDPSKLIQVRRVQTLAFSIQKKKKNWQDNHVYYNLMLPLSYYSSWKQHWRKETKEARSTCLRPFSHPESTQWPRAWFGGSATTSWKGQRRHRFVFRRLSFWLNNLQTRGYNFICYIRVCIVMSLP